MTVSEAIRSALGSIMCPKCGQHMFLRTIMPELENRERMTFTCECGHNFSKASPITPEWR